MLDQAVRNYYKGKGVGCRAFQGRLCGLSLATLAVYKFEIHFKYQCMSELFLVSNASDF